MARGVDGREIFTDDLDRQTFLATTSGVKKETSCSILAYCLMGNHFHFALRVGNIPLSQIMHRLLTAYAMAFNFRHDRQGHLFQARYKAVLCLDDSYLIALIRYIHMNPVRARLVANPVDWAWSSHLDYERKTQSGLADARLFFDALGGSQGTGLDYEQLLKIPDRDFNAWPNSASTSPLFRDENPDEETLDDIASDLFPDDLIMIRSGSRRRDISRKRLLLAESAILKGHQLTSIANWMGRTPQALHNLVQRNKLNK